MVLPRSPFSPHLCVLCLCVEEYLFACVRVCVCVCVCVFVCARKVYACVCVCIYMCVCIMHLFVSVLCLRV